MSKVTLEEWLRERSPAVPPPFLPLLLPEGPGSTGELGLMERGEEALARALDTPGRNREAAFQLLVADAFFTYACEALAREGDVRRGLDELMAHLGDRFR